MPKLNTIRPLEADASGESANRTPRRFDAATPISRRALGLLLFLIAGALLAPIWTVHYPPLVDYPNHLATAFVLAHLKDPAFHFSQFYASDWNTYPYLTMDVILVGLQRFMSIELAGRVLLSLSVLCVPAAAWFFVRQANPGQESLAFWSLLISHNLYFFLWGFTNQQLSLALCFLVVGLWLRHLERPRMTSWCLLLLLTTTLYFTHLVGFGIACLVITTYAILARRRLRDLLSSWILFIPGMLFYLHSMAGHELSGELQFRSVADKAVGLVTVMLGYSPALDFLTLLVMVACLALAGAKNPGFGWNRRWLGVAGVLLFLYCLLPGSYGPTTNIDKRLLPFLFVLGLATVRGGHRGRRLAWTAIVLFALRTGDVERHFLAVQPHLAELAQSFSAIPEDARFLPLVNWAQGMPVPERTFWAYGAMQRGWLSPCLYHDPGVHPFVMKLHTYNPCGQAITPSSPLDWSRIQNEFDYVWAYRLPQFFTPLSCVGKLIAQQSEVQVFQLHKSHSEDGVAGGASPLRSFNGLSPRACGGKPENLETRP